MNPLLYFLIIILISSLVIVLKLDRGILPLTIVRVRILNPELPLRSHAFSVWIRIVLNHNLFSADSLTSGLVCIRRYLLRNTLLSLMQPLLVESFINLMPKDSNQTIRSVENIKNIIINYQINFITIINTTNNFSLHCPKIILH